MQKTCFAALSAVAVLLAHPAGAGSLTRTMEVNAPATIVWAQIGSFCAIKDWHPLVGVCITDGKAQPTRTLVTRDGKASFVELELARDDAKFSYSYSFLASPLPASKYRSTLRVSARGPNASVIVWQGDYTSEPGKDADVGAALANVYDTGLAALKARFR